VAQDFAAAAVTTLDQHRNGQAVARASPQPGEAADAIITVRGLSKTYRSRREGSINALAQTDFTIARGEFVCLVGPSGCGKSTLLKILAGIVPPSTGEFRIHHDGAASDCHIGLVFQSPVLLPWRTVLQNTMVPADVLELDRTRAKARARELIELVGLGGFEESYPAELSGGMQQRCAITRALLHDPPILLMDEPFGALDAMTRDTMNIELLRIWAASGKTVFLITHSIPEAVFLADRVLVMSPRPGRIIEDFRPNLPRPRDLNITVSDAFGVAVTRIRELLGIGAGARPYVD
jgi:NitT/TauT family transport system ATP-binding protein